MAEVAILMGGWSAEREVSLRSGAACANALENSSHTVYAIDVGRDTGEKLRQNKPEVALNMLHGPLGEDGCIQGLLEILQIPYSHSGVLASALAMNKPRARDIFQRAGIPVAVGKVVSRFFAAENHPMRPPYVIKPIANGSSVGVFIVDEKDEPKTELGASDWKYGDEVLVEMYIPGKELTCAVMGENALGVIEITSDLEFYNYDAKYSPGGSKHLLPAPIPEYMYEQVRNLACAAHRALGCRGISRSDFRYDPHTGTLVCLEVNTQPGMTEVSLVPELAAYAGYTFPQLVEWMIADASLNR
ncbi:D-alanine--D-alanine ligase [Candidatus Kaiserbacteria bacterium]|nr:D-alanine--D-alanine ligase [Candidatus Kaiserbacteria bacterium]